MQFFALQKNNSGINKNNRFGTSLNLKTKLWQFLGSLYTDLCLYNANDVRLL